jgi:NodT family efflux transporter outer membrane factor (OMF) lipoprotein
MASMDLPATLVTDNHAIASLPAAAPAAAWWRMFDDERLNALLERGLHDSPALAELEARIGIAQAQIALADARRLPTLDSTARVVAEHLSDNGDHGVYNDRTMSVAEVAPLSLNYHLDLFGREAALVAGATAQRDMADAQYRGAALLLSGAIVKTYFALAIAAAQCDNQRQVVALASAAESVASAAEQAGIQAAAERLPRSRAVAEQRARLLDASQRQRVLGFALSALLGEAPRAEFEAATAPTTLATRLAVPASINLDVLARRPDIAYAQWRIQQAQHRQQAARLAYYPNIDLRGLAGLNSIGLEDLLQAGSLAFAIGPAINLPLFDGGARDAQFDASNAEYSAAVAAYNQTLVNAAQQVASDLTILDHSRQTLAERDAAWRHSAAIASAAARAQASGISDDTPSIDTALNALLARGAYLEQQGRWLDAIADTATALGGGWRAQGADRDD